MDFNSLSYDEILKERAKILLFASKDPSWQAALKEMCKQEPIFFFNFFCYTKDPDKQPANLPFILYPYEKNLIYWLEDCVKNKRNGLIEKTRQMGVTWVVISWLLYKWLFAQDFIALLGSRKEELVDKRDKDDTLFYKLDYNLARLPKWIMPKRFNSVKDRRHLLLINPENGSSIIGESSNQDFGRGGTFSFIGLDEFATWPDASASWDSCSESSKTKIVISTPKAATYFKTLRFSKQMQGKVKTIHWRLHPDKDEAWYEKQKENMSAETLAQEIDISYDVSGRGRVYPEFESVPIGNYKYNPKLPLYTSSDYGLDTTATLWAQQNVDGDIYIIDSYQNEQQTIDFYIPFFTGKVKPSDKSKYTTEELKKIQGHSHWKRARNFGDPAGKQRTVTTDTNVLKILSQAGIYTFTNERATSFPARKEATKILMRRLYVDESNKAFIEAIRQSRYPQRREGSQSTGEISKPIHDQFCLAGNTRIRTLNGWIPIKNLVGQKEIWVWSYSKKEQRLIPARADIAFKSGKNAQLIEIGLDNGNSIKCTLEHKFMMRDESWKMAKDLKVNDSLMPFYETNTGNGYVQKVRFIKMSNHKDVYDLSVPIYHNFVAEGVVVHNSHLRSALEYLAVNLKLVGGPAKRINYLEKKVKLTEDGKITEKQETKEKKGRVVRWTFRSYR